MILLPLCQLLQDLQQLAEDNKKRQADLETRIRDLENHKAALAYAANQTYAQKLAAAGAARDVAETRLRDAEAVCENLPAQEQAENALMQLRKLRDDWDSLHMEAQMLPSAPETPEIPAYFRDEAAVQADYNSYQEATRKANKKLFGILGIVLALIGIPALLIPGWIGKAAGIAAMAIGVILFLVNSIPFPLTLAPLS